MTNPSWNLRDIFGEGVAYVPVPCFDQPGWISADRLTCDVISGNQLALAHDTPVVCHRDAATPRALDLLERAGHVWPKDVRRYSTAREYRALLDQLAREGLRIAVNHAQAARLDTLWIDEDLLRTLADKGELERTVPAHALPRRRRVSAAEFAALERSELPIVAKVSSRQSSGAGYGVRICETPEQLRAAQKHLASAPAVVLEEILAIAGNWCVQFIVTQDGRLHSLGAAEQVTDPDGSWHGNWIAEPAPEEVTRLCATVAEAGARQGYRGVVGIDAVRCTDGRALVLDTNFRLNGSTVALLLRDDLGVSVVRSRGWWFDGGFEEMSVAVCELLAAGRLLPTSFWDPPTGACRVSGLVPGQSRAEVDETLAAMKLAGFR